MKALLISFEFGEHILGGLGRVINGLTEALRQTVELDVYLLYFNPARLAISVKVLRCDARGQGRLIESYTWGYARRCVELIRRERYDVVHFFSVHWIVGNIIERVTAELPQQKIVYSIHSLIRYERGIRRNPPSFFECERRLIGAADVLHVLNETSREYLAQSYAAVALDKPVVVIPNGVQLGDTASRDEALERALERRLSPQAFTIVCLSRWAHGKGLEHLLRAVEQLIAAGDDVQLVLAGRKLISWEMQWYRYVAQVSRMARRLGSRAVVLGWMGAAQRSSLFALADAVVVPSDLEYYPYAVLEPAAHGVPLICSDLPCVREMLEPYEEYLPFERGNPLALGEQVLRLARDDQFGRVIAERARARVLAANDWGPIALEYARLYRAALATKPRARGKETGERLLPLAAAE